MGSDVTDYVVFHEHRLQYWQFWAAAAQSGLRSIRRIVASNIIRDAIDMQEASARSSFASVRRAQVDH